MNHSTTDTHNQIELDLLIWLLAGLLLVVIPHLLRMPFWVPTILSVLIVWRFMAAWRGWPLPGKGQPLLNVLKQVSALVIFVAVYVSYIGKLGRDAGITLLVVLLGLKLIEMHSKRDVYITCFLGYFLIVTNFFFSQTIPTALLMMLVITIMTATLIRLNEGHNSMSTLARLQMAATMLLQSIPVLIIAFLLFPRISGPLWGVQSDAYTTTSGLSETMSPGNISELTQSDAPAFRVKFDGRLPHPTKMYWRGPVLLHTDGRTWTAADASRRPAQPVSVRGEAFSYTVTVEPHNKRWMFALEMPTEAPAAARLSSDYQLLAQKPIKRRMRYSINSYPDYQLLYADRSELELALHIPVGKHIQTRKLADQLRQQYSSDETLIKESLQYFRANGFIYTLTPALLEGDSVDEFMFSTRQGFCEHYAAAFTVLMRAAGIPARVVTGYQGGEYNPVGDYLLVRQRDAHAWSEVWLDQRGWVRVDPTSAVSPNRLEQGMQIITNRALSGLALGLNENATLQSLWRSVSNTLDAVSNGWNQWVLGYSPERQRRLLRELGLKNPDWGNLMLWMVATTVIAMLIVAWWLFIRRPAHHDPLKSAYDRFCRKLARVGVSPLTSEGPIDLCRRACQQLPQSRAEIETITGLYARLRYGKSDSALKQLSEQISQFKPRAG